jgi:hypothetical protein
VPEHRIREKRTPGLPPGAWIPAFAGLDAAPHVTMMLHVANLTVE